MAYPFILYDNIATPTATSEASGYAIGNAVDWRTYTKWKATSTATQYLVFDYGIATDVDALGIATHNLGTAGASVSVESSATGAFAGEETTRLASFSPSDDSIILKPFTSASARYWRVVISGASAAPEIAVICLGARMDFANKIKSPMNFLDESMESSEAISKGGHLLGVVTRYASYTFQADFVYVAMSWLTANFDPFWNAHGRKHKPFFFSLDSDQSFTGRLCRFPEGFTYRKPAPNWDYIERLSLSFEGIA